MPAVVRSQVDVAAPASAVWDYLTDWPRQAEWIPLTRVEEVDSADRVGGRLRAWTGVGPVGFWDTMTITGWRVEPDGSGRCEVLHTGKVVRGEGEFVVEARGERACRFTWWERLSIPGGRAGALGWRVGGRLMEAMVDRSLRTLAQRVEQGAGQR